MLKIPLYIKQFFSYDIKNIHQMLFFQNLVLLLTFGIECKQYLLLLLLV